MNAILRQRLKALGADDTKLKALAELGFSDDTLAELIGDIERTEKDGAARGIRYKGASVSKFPDYDALDHAYDVLDRVKEQRGRPKREGTSASGRRSRPTACAARAVLISAVLGRRAAVARPVEKAVTMGSARRVTGDK